MKQDFHSLYAHGFVRLAAANEANGCRRPDRGRTERHLERSRHVGDTSTEWYTLSENLYRAYLATGDARYREFAAVWEYPEYWDIYLRHADPFATRPSGER